MKKMTLVVSIILAAALVMGGATAMAAEDILPDEGKGSGVDRSIFEPFREKIEALRAKRETVVSNRDQVAILHEEWKTEVEEFKTNREALKENHDMLTEDQKAELRLLLEALNEEGGARKTLIGTRGIQIPRVEAIKGHRNNFKADPNDEDLDSIDVLYDEIMGTQDLRIQLFPEALEIIRAINDLFAPTL